MEEVVDRAAAVGAVGVGNSKRSGSPKYSERAKAPRPAMVLDPKSGSPLLLLSPEEGGCRLYSPKEDQVYETKTNFQGYRFLANSGKWFLVVNSRSELHMVDVFSEERIHLPPLESIKDGFFNVERAGDNEFKVGLIDNFSSYIPTSRNLRGLLWVDDKNRDYVVVWQFEESQFLGFCKKGDLHYRDIPLRVDVRKEFRGLNDAVLKGDNLYYLVTRGYVRHLKLLSAQDGFKDMSIIPTIQMASLLMPDCPRRDVGIAAGVKKVISYGDRLAVTTSGEVLMVYTQVYEPICERSTIFRVFRRELDNTNNITLVELESIGGEALFFDLGITVPSDHTLGIEPNSIYFTRNGRFGHKKGSIPCLDICVYNIATRTIKRFPTLSNLKLKDAHWFLPS